MMKRSLATVVILALIVPAIAEEKSELIGTQALPISLFKLSDNKYFRSKDLLGKKNLVVSFFATWCVPCRAEHNYIKSLSNKGIKIIGINYKDDPKEAIKWLKELGNPYSDVAVDSNGSIAIDWGVYGIPESFIVNTKKIIQHRHVGPITKEEYNEFYLKILKNKD